MKGHPGSGKSTLASSISQALGIPICDKDDIRDCFQPYVMKENADIDWNGLSYQVLLQIVKRQLSNGISAVVDTPLARVSLYQTFEEAAEQAQTNVTSLRVGSNCKTSFQGIMAAGSGALMAAPAYLASWSWIRLAGCILSKTSC